MLADTLDQATGTFLDENKSPAARSARSTTAAATSTSPCTGLRRWPPRATTPSWPRAFAPLADALAADQATIDAELLAVQGQPVDIGGYYAPDDAKATAVMRPSKTFNEALKTLG